MTNEYEREVNIMNEVERLNSIPDEVLFKDCKETDWITHGIPKWELRLIKWWSLFKFNLKVWLSRFKNKFNFNTNR